MVLACFHWAVLARQAVPSALEQQQELLLLEEVAPALKLMLQASMWKGVLPFSEQVV